MVSDISARYEAYKLISISLRKIRASRCRRRGNSLHKDLLVTSMLLKARSVYSNETRQNRLCCPSSIQQSQKGDLNSLGPEPCAAAIPIIPAVSATPVSVSETDNEQKNFSTSHSTLTTSESSVDENEGEDIIECSHSNCNNKTSLLTTRKKTRDTSVQAATIIKSNLSDEEDLEECQSNYVLRVIMIVVFILLIMIVIE